MFPCELKEQAVQPTLSIRFRAPVQELRQHFGRVYGMIIGYLQKLGVQPSGGAFAAYYNMDMQDMDIEAGFTVPRALPGQGEIQAGTIPGGTYAICHYTGPYDQVSPAYEQLMHFAKDKGYSMGTVAYEWYLNGPETPAQDLKTDIAFQVTRHPVKA